MELGGNFWLHAECIIAWRKENNGKNVNYAPRKKLTFIVVTTAERPTMLEDITTIYTGDHDYQCLPWEQD